MRRLVLVLPLVIAAACMTYNQDLERAQNHYNRNQYENALALFRVLEADLDSFSPAEQAQYSYLRGMTDYRLSSVAPQGTGVADPRKGYRDSARHWLAVSLAIEKKHPGGITPEEKQRLGDALTDLNRDVYGGAEALPGDADAGAPAADGAAPAPEAPPPPKG